MRPGAFRVASNFGWPLLVVICLLPVARWATMEPLSFRFGSPVASLLSLGQVTGIIGLTLFAFNLLLSTRIKLFEDLFGGLNKVFIAHHLIGGLALVFLLIHPVMLALRLVPMSVRSAALLLVPQMHNLPVALGIIALLGMVILLILTFYVSLPYPVWLLTHKWLGAFFLLGGLHALLTPNDLSRDPALKFYLLGFVGLGLVSFAYRTLLPRVFVRRYEYQVRSVVVKAPGVVEVDMVPVKRAMNFKAGQFIFVSFRQAGFSAEWHPFTISSAPGRGEVSITVKSLGAYTKTLTGMLPGVSGTKAYVEGAYGRFSFRNFKNVSQVWVAGGIGITPFLSMAQDLGYGSYNIDLYYSVKNESELIDFDKLQSVQSSAAGQTFRVIPFVADKQGFLTAKYIAEQSGDLRGRDVLLCGPPPMMRAMKQQLKALGVAKSRIHSEEFSMS